ncbi:MAG: alpha/beta hydrolase [Phycisphaerales bacterium]|nr:alpha/beta hydrolase [Phycisphaerales bacterium]
MSETPSFRRRWTIRLISLGAISAVVTIVLVVAALLYGWTAFARSLPPLRGWQLDAPESEFVAADAVAGYDFQDYLDQEGEVFTELKALIVGGWSKEVEDQPSRFRPGSACDPDSILDRNWNRSFLLQPEKPKAGILLLHGLSDSPYSVRAIGEDLVREGYLVVGLRIPGHGTCPGALARVSRADWRAAVRVAARGLRDMLPAGAPLVLGGYSNGGALAVDYALSSLGDDSLPRADAIVLWSPMIGITRLARLTRLHSVIASLSGEERANWSEIGAEIDPFKYVSWPMNASVQAWTMTDEVERELARLQAEGRLKEMPPVLAFQSAVDSTVIVADLITRLFDRLPDRRSEMVLFDLNRSRWLGDLLRTSFENAIIPRLRRPDLPFRLALVTNTAPESSQVMVRMRDGAEYSETPLDLAWPTDTYSLSHLAIPFSPTDPVYGTAEATEVTKLPLGSLDLRGETGVLMIPSSMMLRLRHNPFYPYLRTHMTEWLAEVVTAAGSKRADPPAKPPPA